MCEIAGIQFTGRIWNAPVPVSFRDLRELNESDAGAIVIKTITLHRRQGNPNGWSLHEWGSQNNVALHNEGLDTTIKIIHELQPIKPIFVSIYGTEEELLKIVEKLGQLRETILVEWDISCPNAELLVDIDKVLPKLREACKICKLPLGVKIGVDTPFSWKDMFEMNNIDFISTINSINGTSGKVIYKRALINVKEWCSATSIPVIGLGGIENREDIKAFLEAGATAVEIGTEFLRHGVRIFNNPARLKLIPELYKHNIVQRGTFLLKSGTFSDFYIDFRQALSIPELWEKIVVQVLEKVRPLDFDLVCGVPTGAIPLAAIIALQCRKPLLLCRKEAKEHGKKKQVEGIYQPGQKCLVVEDVITSGGSVMNTVATLQEHKLCVNDIFTLANRSDHSRYGGIRIQSLFTLSDLEKKEKVVPPVNNDRLKLQKIMDDKKTKLCFSADVDCPCRLLSILEQVGPYICMVKIHTDTFNSFPDNFYSEIENLVKTHNFMLMADRKLSDIPSIIKKQCKRLKRVAPFSFVTVHMLSGREILDTVQDCGLSVFVVSQMSCNHNDWDPVYTRKAVQLSEHHPVVAGLIAQEKLSESLFHAVPGVGKGKNHRDASELEFADILIVGREIYNAKDPVEVVKKYM